VDGRQGEDEVGVDGIAQGRVDSLRRASGRVDCGLLAYLMQVYAALLRRNTVALDVDAWSGQTGDAEETHHFYPVLCYFRFTDARYSMARTALITLETTALIRTALDARHFGWVRGSAALEQLEESARLLLATLAEATHVPADRVERSATAAMGAPLHLRPAAIAARGPESDG